MNLLQIRDVRNLLIHLDPLLCRLVFFRPLLTSTLLLSVLGSPETRATRGHTLGTSKTYVRLHVWDPQLDVSHERFDKG